MVVFESIDIKNFMSIGNSGLTIKLNKDSTTLITAKNGNGKSSIIDSLCFGLYGKAYRNINLPQLVNSINQKNCVVQIVFSIGTKRYKVIRGLKPKIFEIYEVCQDGNILINQDPSVKDYQKVLEQQYLKMNYRAFTQVVVMGSAAYIPFMKLSTSSRREFIEDLLDIKVFSSMNKLLSQKMKDTKDSLKLKDASIASNKEIIKVIESHIAEKKLALNSDIGSINAEISNISDQNVELMQKTNDLIKSIADLKDEENKLQSTHVQYSDLISLSDKIKNKISTMISDKEKYHTEANCSVCGQNIPEDIKNKFLSDADAKIKKCEDGLSSIELKISKLLDVVSTLTDVRHQITKLTIQCGELNKSIYGNNLLLAKHNKELTKLESMLSSDDSDQVKLKDIAKSTMQHIQDKTELLNSQQIENICAVLLHDSGIKSKIIKQYVPVINKLVNDYLHKLDFFVSFNLDESFNESIKSRHRDAFSYDSFSQGEKQRIDLALIFSWREIARSKNSVNTNLIIMDEVFDAQLDDEGFALAVNLIKTMKDSNVFVVSHRESISDKFSSTIRLIKKNNFTQIL